MVNYEEEKKNLENIAKHLKTLKLDYEFVDLETSEGEKFPAIFTTYAYKGYQFEMHIICNDDWVCAKCFILDTKKLEDPELTNAIYEFVLSLNFELPETTFSAYDGELYLEADMNAEVDFDEFKREWDSIGSGLDIIVEEFAPKEVGLTSTTGEEEEEEKPAKKSAKKSAKKKPSKKKK